MDSVSGLEVVNDSFSTADMQEGMEGRTVVSRRLAYTRYQASQMVGYPKCIAMASPSIARDSVCASVVAMKSSLGPCPTL